jgi:hypothetical protein
MDFKIIQLLINYRLTDFTMNHFEYCKIASIIRVHFFGQSRGNTTIL